MLQHSFVLCLEPPKSAEDHISMLSAAAIDDSDRAMTIAAHHAFLKQSHIIKSISDEDSEVSFFSNYLKPKPSKLKMIIYFDKRCHVKQKIFW